MRCSTACILHSQLLRLVSGYAPDTVQVHNTAGLKFWHQTVFCGLTVMELKKYMCVVCGWVYDEKLGAPQHGLPAGTKWEDVPDDWVCPDCNAGREDFDMIVLE